MKTESATQPKRRVRWAALGGVCVAAALAHGGARSEVGIFKCSGSPVVYTTDARIAANQGCTPLGARSARPQAVFAKAEKRLAGRAPMPAEVVAAVAMPVGMPAGLPVGMPVGMPVSATDSPRLGVIPKSVQAERDRDRYAILQAELTREQDKLVRLQTRLSGARVAEGDAKADPSQLREAQLAIERTEGDIAALGQELKRVMR